MKLRGGVRNYLFLLFSFISQAYMQPFVYTTWSLMEKIEGHTCPRCGQETLDVYYEEGSDLQLGARCKECGLKGFFMNGKLMPLATT